MRILSVALIAFLTLSTVFNWDPGPAPGLSVKNALLYMLAMALLFQYAVERRFSLELSAIPLLFAVLIGYATLTFLAIVLVIDYPRYDMLGAAYSLKNRHWDQLVIFLVFFYGLRNSRDAGFLLRCLLFAWLFSHAVAMLDAFGIAEVGDIERREDGRVQGAIGESNQYGAFVALSLPAMVAAAVAARGTARYFWIGASLLTSAALLMTVSRGAFVAMVAASVWGAWLFRRYLSAGRIAAWALGGGAAVLLVLVVVAMSYGDLLYDRVVAGSRGDIADTSSSRTEVWSDALAVMWEQPITFLTGYGWNAYWAMPFRYSPHNYYLAQWFNLGLPGLICSVALLVVPVRIARAAFHTAPAHVRPLLAGFVLATIAFATATFFVDLYMPWLYYWAYTGAIMRLAVNSTRAAKQPAAASVTAPVHRTDPYGWVGTARQ